MTSYNFNVGKISNLWEEVGATIGTKDGNNII